MRSKTVVFLRDAKDFRYVRVAKKKFQVRALARSLYHHVILLVSNSTTLNAIHSSIVAAHGPAWSTASIFQARADLTINANLKPTPLCNPTTAFTQKRWLQVVGLSKTNIQAGSRHIDVFVDLPSTLSDAPGLVWLCSSLPNYCQRLASTPRGAWSALHVYGSSRIGRTSKTMTACFCRFLIINTKRICFDVFSAYYMLHMYSDWRGSEVAAGDVSSLEGRTPNATSCIFKLSFKPEAPAYTPVASTHAQIDLVRAEALPILPAIDPGRLALNDVSGGCEWGTSCDLHNGGHDCQTDGRRDVTQASVHALKQWLRYRHGHCKLVSTEFAMYLAYRVVGIVNV
ncbi:hypothetical protein C8R44DRAFT_747529 [Mycena epipterygia]|nr:hypothetical protein C8R44DRAFT_747529 [Mycena epipterygia]